MRTRQAALILAPLLVLAGWLGVLASWTKADCTCTVCGRTEARIHVAGLLVSHTLHADSAEYARCFAVAEHEHEWHVESCTRKLFGVECGEEVVAGWFRVLPRIRDREAAGALFAEALQLGFRDRCKLMNEVTSCVWLSEGRNEDLDQAFARWYSQRSQLPAPR